MIDLHLHSHFSDGSDSPSTIVSKAKQNSISAIALTDHDTLEGLAEAKMAAKSNDVELVAGCEVSTVWPFLENEPSCHLLVYFVEEKNDPINEILTILRQDRENRNDKLIERLREGGVDVTCEELRAEAGPGQIGRPHFAAILMKRGLVQSIQEAFDKYLGNDGKYYVKKTRFNTFEIVEAACQSNYLPAVAHPLTVETNLYNLSQSLKKLKQTGLVGVECYYSRYSIEERSNLKGMADEIGLVATGGSDYHGIFKPDIVIGIGKGDLEVPDGCLKELKRCLGYRF